MKPTIQALLEAGVKVKEEVKMEMLPSEKKFSYVVCFTGVRPTDEEQSRFIQLGGVVKSGVSKGLTHLVVKDPNTTSNKAEKARGLGIQVVSYDDFKGWLK